MPAKIKKTGPAAINSPKVSHPEADCHHMIRRIGFRTTEGGTKSVDLVDADLREPMCRGYRLSFASSLGLEPEGANTEYLLIRNDPKTRYPNADCHHMIRRIGPRSIPEDGTRSVEEANADINTWLQSGYDLAFKLSLGLETNGANSLYIFVKYE